MCNEIIENMRIKNRMPKINWSSIDKGKYLIYYTIVPCLVIAKIVTKTNIPGVNSCLESDIYLFETLTEAEEFFEKLTGEK